jgi:radical SAM superfamily enzyme YgiQ (UPF0313 family)
MKNNMPNKIRRILLVQLPVPPPGPQISDGNLPVGAAFLKLFARRQGLDRNYEIEIFQPRLVNMLGDQALLQAVLQRDPDLVGFTCYVWNVERSLWLAEQIKHARPEVKILLGGPEITADNHWVLENAVVDHAVFGEGEAAFGELLSKYRENASNKSAVSSNACIADGSSFRSVHSHSLIDPLDAVSSPYLEGILDVGEQKTMLLESVRGCRFQCKYCYYSKRSAKLRYLSFVQIEANLQYAIARGMSEVYLLDPTINQRPDFNEFLQLLSRCNPDRQLTFSGELRAEGIDAEIAKLLRAANFTELEIGLQSVEPLAHRLMGRPVNLESWQRGVNCLMAEGIRVRLDLILGLPGDTVESICRGIDFLARFRPEAEIQIFNLSILPGTDFRREAASLGLKYQAKPPYYVFQTPALDAGQMYSLMEEAQATLDIQFDRPPLPFDNNGSPLFAPTEDWLGKDKVMRNSTLTLDLDDVSVKLPSIIDFDLVTTLLLHSSDFSQVGSQAVRVVAEAVRTNPHITFQIVFEPRRQVERLQPELLRKIIEACYSSTSYLDRFYSMQPGHLLGAKQLFVLLPLSERARLKQAWIHELGQFANILWYGDAPRPTDLEEFEHALSHCVK